MKQIPLTQGKFAIVDDKDYDWLNRWKWYARKDKRTFYALRTTNTSLGNIRVHRLVLGLKKGDGKFSDHCNHNGLDNRRTNLRICTRSQNQQNMFPYKSKSSQYKGVSWHKENRRWRATIQKNSKLIHLGSFVSEIEAAKKYNKVARELFGEFAFLNIF